MLRASLEMVTRHEERNVRALAACRFALGAGVLLGAGCSGPELPKACDGTSHEAIVDGSASETYLGLTDAQTRAIVEITTEDRASLCSGAFVRANWVITAAHCLEIENALVVVNQVQASPISASVLRSVASSLADVALLEIDDSVLAGADFVPLDSADASGPTLAAPTLVELAGYGLTETGDAFELRFAVEPIVEVSATSVVVTGSGASGACAGDSGGPLLVRGPDGSVRVAGTLASGSAECNESDRYERLDVLADWIGDVTSSALPSVPACGGIDATGRCLYGSAMWCEGAELVTEQCGAGTTCGWDPSGPGFRCVEPAHDACHGVDAFGACRGGAALRCDGGVFERVSCGCSEACRADPGSGQAVCAAPK